MINHLVLSAAYQKLDRSIEVAYESLIVKRAF